MLKPGFYNKDCMKYLSEFPDDYFGLALVDPPYGDGNDGLLADRFGERFDRYKINGHEIEWDKAPNKEYFKQLFRITKNQIIWGGVTTMIYQAQDVLWFGGKQIYRHQAFLCRL